MARNTFNMQLRGATNMIRIVYIKLLNGWYVVRGKHWTPISGRFASKAEALAWLNRKR